MSSQKHSYVLAVSAIRSFAQEEQERLDAIALASRKAALQAICSAATEGLDPEGPAYVVGALVAQTAYFDEGYPVLRIPETTQAVLRAAYCAKVIPEGKVGTLVWHSDYSGLRQPEVERAGDDWMAADRYRRDQRYSNL